MRKTLLSIALAATMSLMPSAMMAQRMQQPLGRGVVAVYGKSNGSAGVEITWRRLAQEPEDIQYNVYVAKASDGPYTQLNDKPLTNTNFATTLTRVPYGSYVAVGIEGKDGEMSKPFLFKQHSPNNVFMEIKYDASPLKKSAYTTKFVWPVDLDGDGEYDYVVDRCPVDGTRNFFVEGYLADGTFLWCIDLGPNERPCDGQNDNMCAYDIDCDGFGELIVQTSDGARFWDKATGTWGKYLLGKATGDSDGDGIIDYDTQSTKNPPRYMTVVDGMTGEEKASVEFKYDDAYNRTNKASLMGDEYNKHEAHVAIAYLDGVHPAIVGEWHSRSADGNTHFYRNCAFQYVDGEWKQLFMEKTGGAEFHMIRIFDADGDGRDEMSSGAYVMDHDGSTLYNTGISHGDRHRTSDIDPERPGLETFSIQQNAPDMLGMILYDAGTGESIKRWYLPAVGDVGRGDCMDLDPSHLGWEMFSTMDNYQMFDAKGNKIEGKYGFFPTESIWWDGQLDRERLDTPDGNGYNAMVVDYQNGRLIEMAKESGWTLKSSYGKRAKYWGDIVGDWREEVILIRETDGVCQGIVGFSTDFSTKVNNIYCLQQDPHYRMDCTTRGYYQSPNPGFYLGYDMPRPQLPPCMVADDETDVFGIAQGTATITPRPGIKSIYAMPVKGQTLTLASALSAGATLYKSQLGTLDITCESLFPAEGGNLFPAEGGVPFPAITSQGKVVISEGTVSTSAHLATVDLRARGTLAGSALVDDLIIEGALHYEGCRLMPHATMTIANTIDVPAKKKLYIELTPGKDLLKASIDLKGTIAFNLPDYLEADEYTLIEGCEGIDIKKLEVRGLKGLSYSFKLEGNLLKIVVNKQRNAAEGVVWTGSASGTWDYKAENFAIDGNPTYFVAGDAVVFNDDATKTTITLNEMMPVASATFASEKKSYTINGTGGIEGKTILKSGKLTVKEPQNYTFEIGKATLVVNNSNAGTDRAMTLTDTATISIASGIVALKGKISGDGTLLKAGNGQLNVTYAGTNAWKETILQAGTLAMGAWNTTFGKATSPIHVTGNSTLTIFNNNTTSAIPQFQNAVTIDKGKTLTFHAGQRCAIKGTLLGEGTLKIDFPYVRGDVSTNCSKFEGTYQVTSSNCRFIQAMDLSKATLQLDAGAYAAGFKAGSGNEQSYTHKIGTLTGTGTLGTGIWQVSKVVSLATPLTINGTLKLANATLDVSALCKKKLSDNTELKLFTIKSKATITGDITIIPATPKEGWKWDTTTLATDGTLRIAEDPTAIHSPTLPTTSGSIFDLQGRPVTNPTHGVYIINGKKMIVK